MAQTGCPFDVMPLRTVNILDILRKIRLVRAGLLCVLYLVFPRSSVAQWPSVAEIAGRGGAAGAAEGVLSPLRPAQLLSQGTWHVRLDHQIPFGLPEVATAGVRLGYVGNQSRGRPAWLTMIMATQFDAYSALRVTVSHSRTVTESRAHTVRLGASVGLDHEKMGVLGTRRTPILVFGGSWHPFSKLFTAVSLLNGRASRLNGAVVRLDVTWEEVPPWPLIHASLSMDPEHGVSVHIGSTWIALEQVHMELGGASNPFRVAASVQILLGSARARVALQWTPMLGSSRWLSAGWS